MMKRLVKGMWRRVFLIVLLSTLIILSVLVAVNPMVSLWLLLLVVVSGFGVLGWYVDRRIVRPMERLTLTINKIHDGERDARVLAITRNEAGDLIRAFNEMSSEQIDRMGILSDERELLFTVFSQMSDAVIVTNRAGHVTVFNAAAAKLFDLTESNSIGRTLAESVRHHEIIDLWHRCAEQQQEQATVVDVRNGGLFLQVNMLPIAAETVEGYIVIVSDLTTVRRLETVRRDFISNVSHELKTPLASLSAVVETLQDGAIEDPPAAERFLSRASNEVDTMNQMVSELLELSRIESGRVPFRFTQASLIPLVESAVDHLQSQIKRKSLQLSVELAADLPDIMADEARIKRVIINLLHNATKFTLENGQIKVKASADESRILLTIEDSGVGIAADDLPRIFERFYKIDRSRNSVGTGLGLAIAKHIVQAHQGEIWVESQEGRGSTFFVSLPQADRDRDMR